MNASLLRAAALLLLTLPAGAQQRDLDACGILDRPGMTYVLQKDVSSPGSCFLIKAERITLDLNGHTITYGTASAWEPGQETTQRVHGILGQACWDKGGQADPAFCGDTFQFFTVKNGAIVQAEGAPPYSHAIRMGQGAPRRVVAEDVRFRIYSPSSTAVYITGGRGGHLFRNVTVENESVYVLNRHQLEGMALRLVEAAKDGDPVRVDNLRVIGGPQGGAFLGFPGSTITGAAIALKGAFTNDFGIYLWGDGSEAHGNTIRGRSRGVQVHSDKSIVRDNVIETHEEPVNEEYDGCQVGGTYGVQLESRASRAVVRNNQVRVKALACDGRAFRATGTKAGSGNISSGNVYAAVREPGAGGKAVAASFSNARDVTLEGDTLIADTWNTEIVWDGARNIVLKNVTFIKGENAGRDYATFSLLPGTNNAKFRPTSAEMKVIDPVFRTGASADSFLMRPIGFERWATAAEYSIHWTYSLTIVGPDQQPLPGVAVRITDHKGDPHIAAVSGPDGRVPPLVLTDFRRFNTTKGIEKEEFSYTVELSLGERRREFTLRVSAPTERTELLP